VTDLKEKRESVNAAIESDVSSRLAELKDRRQLVIAAIAALERMIELWKPPGPGRRLRVAEKALAKPSPVSD
jgi:hypothetical protein